MKQGLVVNLGSCTAHKTASCAPRQVCVPLRRPRRGLCHQRNVGHPRHSRGVNFPVARKVQRKTNGEWREYHKGRQPKIDLVPVFGAYRAIFSRSTAKTADILRPSTRFNGSPTPRT